MADAPWTTALRALWSRIERHDLEPGHALDFTRRLARDKSWTLDFARRAIGEYGRFCFLAVAAGHAVTPSEEIDEVWHQHLTFSRDYWEVWCPVILGAPLHHEPTLGGPVEQTRFREQYARTLATYETFFGAPDPMFWPATHRRFRDRQRFRTVDGDHCIVLPRPSALFQRLWPGG